MSDRYRARVAARVSAGFDTVDDAARKLRRSPEYLARIERNGKASWVMANKLARLYRCNLMLFL